MITCTLGDKKYTVDYISGRALREMEPAAKMYSRIVAISNAAVKGETIPQEEQITIPKALDVMVKWFCLLFGNQFTVDEVLDGYPVDRLILKLSEVYQNPTDALSDPNAHFYKDGIEIPVETVPSELLTANRMAVLGTDGAMHILIAADVTGAEEAISELRTEVAEVDQFGTTAFGKAVGLLPTSTMDLIDSAMQRMAKYKEGGFWNWLTGATNKGTLDFSMNSDFNADRVSELSTYVAEVVSAIAQGKEVKQEDLDNLQTILTFLQELDTTETGTHILEGVAEGMTTAGWDSDAETVASNLETALNTALNIHSPSERMKPTGDYVAQGVGAGMAAHDFSTDAAAMASAVESAVGAAFTADMLSTFGISAAQGLASAIADYSMASAGSSISSNVQSAVSSSLTSTSLRSVGVNAMAGLRAGILAGQSGVISAMRSAAQAAVNAAT